MLSELTGRNCPDKYLRVEKTKHLIYILAIKSNERVTYYLSWGQAGVPSSTDPTGLNNFTN